MYYRSFLITKTWLSGVTILLLLIATAFLGYVLPWGQISFWGATVITNLFSAIPVVGNDLVQYLWGGYSVRDPTLKRFFTLHFILPFILLFFSLLHVFFLHERGSSNPLGLNTNSCKVPFYPYRARTDLERLLNIILFLVLFSLGGLLFFVEDPDNFNIANPLIAPPHIQPEWYFLFAYAILRSIPNKLGGVLSLVASVIIFYILPFTQFKKFKRTIFNPGGKILFWFLVRAIFILTWIGARPVEYPYILIGQTFTVVYFIFFIVSPFIESKEM